MSKYIHSKKQTKEFIRRICVLDRWAKILTEIKPGLSEELARAILVDFYNEFKIR